MTDLLERAKSFRIKKQLGQHFLVDEEKLEQIVDALAIKAGDLIVEIGPGIGFLTEMLASTGNQIVAVDLDQKCIAHLQDKALPNVTLKHGDFLDFDLNRLEFIEKKQAWPAPPAEPSSRHMKVIGNVPYQITGLILGHLLGELDKPSPWLSSIESIVLTVQYEVAKRIVAKAGDEDYSKVSLLATYYCHSQLKTVIPADAFFPRPAVNSAVVQLIPRAEPAVKTTNIALLKQVIEAGFRQRRKMLKNALSFLRFSEAEVSAVFDELKFDPLVRAERLSIEQFALLTDAFDSRRKRDDLDKEDDHDRKNDHD